MTYYEFSSEKKMPEHSEMTYSKELKEKIINQNVYTAIY